MIFVLNHVYLYLFNFYQFVNIILRWNKKVKFNIFVSTRFKYGLLKKYKKILKIGNLTICKTRKNA